MTTTPSDVAVIKQALSSKMLDVHTALPGCIVKYNSLTQSADVQIEVNRSIDKDDVGNQTTEQIPELPDIPIVFPGVGDYSITFPLAPGDPVLVVFCESSIDSWRVKGGLTDPGDIRRHNLGSAIAIPGLRPDTKLIADPNNTDMTIGKAGGQKVTIKGSTVEVSDDFNAADFVAMAAKVLTQLQSIKTSHDSHIHTILSGSSAGSTTAPTVPMTAPSAVPSSNLKADN